MSYHALLRYRKLTQPRADILLYLYVGRALTHGMYENEETIQQHCVGCVLPAEYCSGNWNSRSTTQPT